MEKNCAACGAKLPEEALFCEKCGQQVEIEGNETCRGNESPETENVSEKIVSPEQVLPQKRTRKKGELVAEMREFTQKYIMRLIALVACLTVFISGFFVNIGFMPMEQVQSKIVIDMEGNVDLEQMLGGVEFDQNIFNVLGALTVGTDAEKNEEEYEKILQALTARTTECASKYEERITDLLAKVQQGDTAAVAKLTQVYKDYINDLASSVGDINLIKLDRLEAELGYSGNSSESTLKYANDTIIRTSVLAGYAVGVIYLQVVSLVFLILISISFLRKHQNHLCGKFFFMYLLGFVFLFGLAQFSATSVGGTGMFCFVWAVVLGALYLAFHVFSGYKITAESLIRLVGGGITTVLSFSALCLLFGNIFEFGGMVDKVGSVFGLHVFDSYVFDVDEGLRMTLLNFGMLGGIYLAVYVLAAIVFFRSLIRLYKDTSNVKTEIVISSVTAGIAFLSYIALFICCEFNAVELLIVPSALFAVVMLHLCCVIVSLFMRPIQSVVAEEKAKKSKNNA